MSTCTGPDATPAAMTLPTGEGMSSLGAVRAFLRRECSGTLAPAGVEDAELLGSELVTNALRHGAAPIRIEVDRVGGAVRVAVCDRGSGRPRPRAGDSDAESGRGLALVRALSQQWGVRELDSGKAVWFTLVHAT